MKQLRANIIPLLICAIITYGAYLYFKQEKDNNEPQFNGTDYEPMSGTPTQRNFNVNEFACKDGTPVPAKYYGNLQVLMSNLQVLRDYLNTSVTVNSGYRTTAYNQKVGGATNSTHKRAMAADITAKGYTPAQVHAAIEKLISEGRMKDGGLGKYRTFTHYDVRPIKSRWSGN